MKNRKELWERVHERLDERRDPFGDPEVNEALLEDAGALEEVTRLRAALRTIEGAPRRVPRWRAIGAPVAAGLFGLLVLGEFASRGSAPEPRVAAASEPATRSLDPPRILELHMEVVTESPGRRITTHFDGETFSRRFDLLAAPGNGGHEPLTGTALSTSVSRRL